jgi:hypothetical protein
MPMSNEPCRPRSLPHVRAVAIGPRSTTKERLKGPASPVDISPVRGQAGEPEGGSAMRRVAAVSALSSGPAPSTEHPRARAATE